MLMHIVFKTLIKYSKIILPIGLVITFSGAHLERIDYHSSAIYKLFWFDIMHSGCNFLA